MEFQGNQTLITDSKGAFGEKSKYIDKSTLIKNYGLNEQVVVKLLSEMEESLKIEISQNGQDITADVSAQITELVEN